LRFLDLYDLLRLLIVLFFYLSNPVPYLPNSVLFRRLELLFVDYPISKSQVAVYCLNRSILHYFELFLFFLFRAVVRIFEFRVLVLFHRLVISGFPRLYLFRYFEHFLFSNLSDQSKIYYYYFLRQVF